VRCDDCDEPAAIDQPYAAAHLCARHFSRSVEERVRREMHRQAPRFPGGVVAVALSGGKDSSVALQLTHRHFSRRPNVHLIALTIDEGIPGYRPATVEAARALTGRLGVEHRLVSARERLGTTTDETARARPEVVPCSFCGVWRRRLLNDAAREVGADLLVLGFNLDDLAQTVLMNLARGDVDRIPRMAPHRQRQPGLVPRIAPLATVPEREVFLYAHLEGLPFDHGVCPHADRASRNVFREVVWRLEEELPGTRHALLKTQRRIAELLSAPALVGAPNRCVDCGEAAAGERCRPCEYLKSMGRPSPAMVGP